MDLVGLVVVLGTLAVATVAGLVMKARSGRVRDGRIGEPGTAGTGSDGWALAGVAPGAGRDVLLLQLSSPVCTPCRQTAAVLEDLTVREPRVAHVEIDVADRPDVARELGVMRTPTTVAFGRGGAELLRVSGVPRVAELEGALARALA
ncbi:MAG: thioredoxin family protein [Pseudonocardia sp.]|nr:thioredoxin family protein [Pseudonocardia sp.]